MDQLEETTNVFPNDAPQMIKQTKTISDKKFFWLTFTSKGFILSRTSRKALQKLWQCVSMLIILSRNKRSQFTLQAKTNDNFIITKFSLRVAP